MTKLKHFIGALILAALGTGVIMINLWAIVETVENPYEMLVVYARAIVGGLLVVLAMRWYMAGPSKKKQKPLDPAPAKSLWDKIPADKQKRLFRHEQYLRFNQFWICEHCEEVAENPIYQPSNSSDYIPVETFGQIFCSENCKNAYIDKMNENQFQ
jgi:hypothetical protein